MWKARQDYVQVSIKSQCFDIFSQWICLNLSGVIFFCVWSNHNSWESECHFVLTVHWTVTDFLVLPAVKFQRFVYAYDFKAFASEHGFRSWQISPDFRQFDRIELSCWSSFGHKAKRSRASILWGNWIQMNIHWFELNWILYLNKKNNNILHFIRMQLLHWMLFKRIQSHWKNQLVARTIRNVYTWKKHSGISRKLESNWNVWTNYLWFMSPAQRER